MTGAARGENTLLAELRTTRSRVAATLGLAIVVNLFLGYVGNSVIDMPWRLLETWVLPRHGWAEQPSPADTDDGMGPAVAAIVLLTVPYLLMCVFANYLVVQAVNVFRAWYAFVAAAALIAPAVAFTIDPMLYAEIPRP